MALNLVRTVEDAIDRVYQAPFASFVATRNELAADLKRAGHLEAAASLKTRSKPSLTAWAVNQLYWRARKDLDALLDAGDRVRAGERALLEGRQAASHGEAVQARQKALARLLERADAIVAEEGLALSPAVRQRLHTTLEALAAFGTDGARHRHGRLVEDLDPPGFEALMALAPAARATPARGAKASKARPGAGKAKPSVAPESDGYSKLRGEIDTERRELARAQKTQGAAEATLETARAELEIAERRMKDAMTRAAAAGKAAERARADVTRATDRLAELQQELERLRRR
jgi:hypothetical protein